VQFTVWVAVDHLDHRLAADADLLGDGVEAGVDDVGAG
jgi:hypothetical protein